MTKGWTEERRKAQAERCRRNKPWEHATGPKTAKGKRECSMNALKHGNRSRQMTAWKKEIERILYYNREFVKHAHAFTIAEMALETLTNKVKEKRLKSKGTPTPLPNGHERTEA